MNKRFLISGLLVLLLCAPEWCLANVIDTFERIKSNPNALYAFLKEMPKGGELHYHLAGGAYPEAMLTAVINSDAKQYCLDKHSFTVSAFSEQCSGVDAHDLFDYPQLYQQAIRAWSMKDFIAGQESGHDHFFASFYKFMPLVSRYEAILLAGVMQRAADQQELYMEIMIMPDNAKSTSLVDLHSLPRDYLIWKQQLMANKDFVDEIHHTVTKTATLLADARQYLGCDKKPETPVCQLTVRFQYHVLREQPLDKLFAQTVHAFAVAELSPTIVGINLVQAEDGLMSLRDYREQMRIFAFLHPFWPKVSIDLHAGELYAGDVNPEELRFHIHDAIEIAGAKRIGHGVDIGFEHHAESLAKAMAVRQIAVEINLVSNQHILGVSGQNHPLRYYLANQVPVVLSTDDEGILRTDLTQQYVEAVRQHDIDYVTLKRINRNALTYSFLPGNSLWQDAFKAIPVTVCKDLNSKSCLSFIASNQKARLQRLLELKLSVFEQGYVTSKPQVKTYDSM